MIIDNNKNALSWGRGGGAWFGYPFLLMLPTVYTTILLIGIITIKKKR
jgi:hypothetical protein